MSEYTPDCWVAIKLHFKEKEPYYRILAGWYGGFAGSNSWKLSSGIEEIIDEGTHYRILQTSGSVYLCGKNLERMSDLTLQIYVSYVSQLKEGEIFEVVDIGEVLTNANKA